MKRRIRGLLTESAKLPKKLHLEDLLTRPEFTRAKL